MPAGQNLLPLIGFLDPGGLDGFEDLLAAALGVVVEPVELNDLLAKIGIAERKVLILTNGSNSDLYLSVRNLPNVAVLPYREVSAYDVLNANELLIEADAFNAPKEEDDNA